MTQEPGTVWIGGVWYTITAKEYDNGNGDTGTVFHFESDAMPVYLPPEKELIFNAEKLTYEPKYPDSKENEGSKPE